MKANFLTPDLLQALSPLENDIVTIMQAQKQYGAAEMYTLISKKKKVAPSSVSVILDRLYKKGLVSRETETARGGIRFRYRLEANKERYERTMVENTVNLFVKKFGAKALAYFNESFDQFQKKRT